MPKKSRSEASLLVSLHRQMQRPGQAPVGAEHWIVLNFSVHKNLHFTPPRFPFRHPTEKAARDEADRLANLPNHIGWRFGVFHYTGVSVKVVADAAEPIKIDQAA